MSASKLGRLTSSQKKSIGRPHGSKRERLLQEALDLKNNTDYGGALNVLVKLTRQFPDYAPAFRLAAGLFLQTEQMRKAITFGKKAVSLAPKSELASAILFQAYLAIGNRGAATKELKRFIQIGKSEHYRLFLKDLAEQETDSKRRDALLRLADRMAT